VFTVWGAVFVESFLFFHFKLSDILKDNDLTPLSTEQYMIQ